MLEVRASVRRAYFGQLIAGARLTLLEELRDFATRARDAAEQRFQAGSAPRLEVLQSQLALSQAENEATAARGAVVAARAELNALLAFPLDAPTSLVTPLDAGDPPEAGAALQRALDASAELGVLNRRIEEQRARLALARALQVPDVTPEATITRDAEPEFSTGWRVAVAVSVPVFTRHRAGVHVEEATLAQLTAEREAAIARIGGAVASAAAVAGAQRQQYVRYRDQILPQELEVERMAEDAYRLGQTGIAALLQALQGARDARLRALQAASEFQTALTDLERAIGVPLP
jgi:cobalt-zinc-cadmium efflux system outer membrane protein